LFALAACHAPSPPRGATARGGAGRSAIVASNILRADYAGSQACVRCHEDIARAWSASPMHNMTRLAATAEIHAPFDGGEFRFKDDRIQLETHDGARFMRLQSATQGTHLYRVTKVIGGHHREDFAGVEVDEALAPVGDPRNERVLPATYMLEARRWRYKGYSVMHRERPGLRPGAVWKKTCIFCHNTEPYLSNLLGTLAGPATPAYQGELVDPLLPEARRWKYEIADEAALRRALEDEVALLRGKRASLPGSIGDALGRAVQTTRAGFDERHLVEVGIGCESCHNGGKAHVEHVGTSPSFEPRSPFLRVVAATGKSRAQQINRVCARCHQVLFSQYTWTWEGGRRSIDPGGSNINSGEGRDFLLGGCASEMSCVTCHDPHAPDNRKRMDALEGAAGSAICVRCHSKYSTVAAQRAHSHHDPAGAGGQCFGCHLPKKDLSLDNRLSRYHRIGSPTDVERVERDRPLECALCHADQSVGTLVETMERWWGKRYDRVALRALYGALDANPILATVSVGKPHEQAVAMAILGEHKVAAALPLLSVQLTHPIPIVRYYAVNAIEAVLGHALPIDLFTDNAKIRARADALLPSATGVVVEPAGKPAPAEGEDEDPVR